MTSKERSLTSGKTRKRVQPQYTRRSPEADDIFFKTMETGRNVAFCAAAAGYAMRTCHYWREKDEEFAARWRESYAIGADTIENIAHNRAIDGWKEPVFYQGKPVGEVTRYDHNLLMRILEVRKPEYRQKLDVSGEVEHRHTVEHVLRAANDRARQAVAHARGLPSPQPALIDGRAKVVDNEGA